MTYILMRKVTRDHFLVNFSFASECYWRKQLYFHSFFYRVEKDPISFKL